MLIYIRHGETNLNGPAGSSEERLRGWLPANLTPKGQQQAHEAGEKLRGITPSSFYTSDLPRATETANIVGSNIGSTATPTFALRDWNTGDLAGHRFPDVKDQLFYLMDHPDEPAPNGESLNTYINRFIPFIKGMVESPDTHIVVGHARGTQVIHALANTNGQWVSPAPLKEKPVVEPGQAMIVTSDWSTIPKPTTQMSGDT